MTKRMRKTMKYAAKITARYRRNVAPKEAPMSPTTEQIRIPDSARLERRPTCHQQNDERPVVRNRDGYVLAVLESWRPDFSVN